MGYNLEINSLLKVPEGALDLSQLATGSVYELSKEGQRLYPLNIPVELCDHSYRYLAKVKVTELCLSADKTNLKIEVIKVFSEEESEVFSRNFIAP